MCVHGIPWDLHYVRGNPMRAADSCPLLAYALLQTRVIPVWHSGCANQVGWNLWVNIFFAQEKILPDIHSVAPAAACDGWRRRGRSWLYGLTLRLVGWPFSLLLSSPQLGYHFGPIRTLRCLLRFTTWRHYEVIVLVVRLLLSLRLCKKGNLRFVELRLSALQQFLWGTAFFCCHARCLLLLLLLL